MGLQITWQVVHVAVPLWVLEGSLPPHLIRFRTDLVQHLRTWAKRKHIVSGIGILFCRVTTYFKCITSTACVQSIVSLNRVGPHAYMPHMDRVMKYLCIYAVHMPALNRSCMIHKLGDELKICDRYNIPFLFRTAS